MEGIGLLPEGKEKNMLTTKEIIQLIQSLIWLLAGVGVFIVGMNFLRRPGKERR